MGYFISKPSYDKVYDCWCVQVATDYDDYDLLCFNEFGEAYSLYLKRK